MIIKNYLFSIILSQSLTFSQWISFDLSSIPVSLFQEQVEPFTRSISFMIGHPVTSTISENNRFQGGVSFGMALDLSNKTFNTNPLSGFPSLHGSFLVTENLRLNGAISGFSSGNDMVQVSSYGLDLLLSKENNNSINMLMNFGYLDGPSDFRCRTIHSSINRMIETRFIPIEYGVGINFYSAHISQTLSNEIRNKIKGQTNFVFVGLKWPINKWEIGTNVIFHPNTIFISIDLLKGFR